MSSTVSSLVRPHKRLCVSSTGCAGRIDELVKDLQKEGLPRVGIAEPSTGRVP